MEGQFGNIDPVHSHVCIETYTREGKAELFIKVKIFKNTQTPRIYLSPKGKGFGHICPTVAKQWDKCAVVKKIPK